MTISALTQKIRSATVRVCQRTLALDEQASVSQIESSLCVLDEIAEEIAAEQPVRYGRRERA